MPKSAPTPARLTLALVSLDRFLEKEFSPLLDPGIHPEAAEDIQRQADDHSSKGGYEIILQVPEADRARLDEARLAISTWATHRAQIAQQEVRGKLRKGSKTFALALVVVAGLFLLVEWLQAFGQGHLYRLFGESLIIIAWVSLWVPLETLLVEPLHLRHKRRLFQALAAAKVSLIARGTANR
jgi:hypothetical protein